jgi:hyperosmotically inducible periplasmic protein
MNSRNRIMFLAALSAGTFLAGCSDHNSTETVGAKLDRNAEKVAAATDRATTLAAIAVDDATITAKVKAAVLAEPGLKTLQIDVDTKDGVVTLSGTVDNPALKERTSQITQNVSGVRSVVDHLAVKSTG